MSTSNQILFKNNSTCIKTAVILINLGEVTSLLLCWLFQAPAINTMHIIAVKKMYIYTEF